MRNKSFNFGKRVAALSCAVILTISNIPVLGAAAEGQTIYVSGSASEEGSGYTVDSPIPSIYTAQEMLPEGGTIVVLDTFYVSKERNYYLNSGITIKAADSLEGPVFSVAEGARLTLNNASISGNGNTIISNLGVVKVSGSSFYNSGESISAESAVSTGDSASTYYDDTLLEGIGWAEPESEPSTDASTEKESSTESESETWTEGSTESERESWTEENTESESETWTEGSTESERETWTEESTESERETWTEESTESESETWTEGSTESEGETWTESSPKGDSKSEGEAGIEDNRETESETQTESQQGTDVSEEIEPQQPETRETTEAEEKSKAVRNLEKQILGLSVHSREDVKQVLKADKAYEALSQEEKSAVSDTSKKLLEDARQMAAAYNHTQLGVTVYGDLPWYVEFKVTKLDVTDEREQGLTILIPYELKLWDMYENENYVLEGGETVTISMPIPDVENYQAYTIFHYKEDGELETITPEIKGNLMYFSTGSFSPFSVAGSTIEAGIGVPTGTSGGSTEGNNTTSVSDITSGSSSPSITSSSTQGSTYYNGTYRTNVATAVNTGDNSTLSISIIMAGLSALCMAAALKIGRKSA